MSTVIELGRYLHALSDLYPHGVFLPSKQKLMLIVSPQEQESQRELLHSIIEKGMKMSPEEVHIVDPSRLPTPFSTSSAISFGFSFPEVLVAPGLREIGENPEAKKKFWESLKNFLKQRDSSGRI